MSSINDLVAQCKDVFGLGDRSIVGIDIGLSAVKVAQVEHLGDGNIKLTRWASVALPEAALIEDDIQKAQEITDAIKSSLDNAGIKSELVSMALSGPSTMARKLTLSMSSPDEFAENVAWEAEQYLSFDPDEAAISFHEYGENDAGGVDVFVAAAHKGVIDNFKALVESSGKLRVKIVDLSVICVANVFELVMEKSLNNTSSYLVFDIGAQKTDCLIYKSGMVCFTKRIPIGGSTITEEIQRQMGVNHLQAEDLKITRDSNGNLPEEVLEVVENVLEQFYAEIKKTLDFYITATSDEDFAGCWLTGGASQTAGLVEGLENLLGISIHLFNPFDRIKVGDLSEEQQAQAAATGVTAIGLAMRTLK
ncbi:MAG: type IV pilus assembly protein PilM [Bacteriovoracaceae bacterium]|nr:type IV pilus assembly protein PilM [Bacteriovoracaceae bacterium]